MTLGLVGRKCGMSRLFTEQGASIPVTLIQVEPHHVTQVKNLETDGYVALQVTTGSKKRSRINNLKLAILQRQMLSQVLVCMNFVLLMMY